MIAGRQLGIDMTIHVETLDEAIAAFLATLDDKRKDELRELIPTSRVETPRRWMEEVINMFGLEEAEQPLCKDIEECFPDESVFKGRVFDNDRGFFEAGILLREAKKILLKQA